jgi:hypothetical protein
MYCSSRCSTAEVDLPDGVLERAAVVKRLAEKYGVGLEDYREEKVVVSFDLTSKRALLHGPFVEVARVSASGITVFVVKSLSTIDYRCDNSRF